MRTKIHNRFKLWFDRLLSKSLIQQFAFLGVLLFALFLLSWFLLNISGCNWKDFAHESKTPEWLLPLYLLIDTNAFNNLYINGVHGWALFFSSISFLTGAFIFNGAIIGLITSSIERRVSSHKEGNIYYLESGHYIIMGYDDMVPSIITYIFEKDKKAYVLLLTSAETASIKEKLDKSFSKDDMKRIIINFGHRVSAEYYKDIHLEKSEEIYIVGNRQKAEHDAINVECVDSICRYLKGKDIKQKPTKITCVFKDLDTYAAFKTSEIFDQVKDLGMEFVPYNFHTGWAKQVFVKSEYKDFDNPDIPPYKYPCVYGKGITPDDEKYVHLVFVGTTNFAVAFAMEAAHVLHFPNADKAKTLITFIDMNADKEKDEFITRNRHFFEVQAYRYRDLTSAHQEVPGYIGKEYLQFSGDDANFLDVEFEFIKGDVFSKRVQDLISSWAVEHNEANQKQCLSIFLALADQRQNFVMGMNMPDEVYANEVPIFIRQDRSDNFVTNLRQADEKIREDNKKNTYYAVKNGAVTQSKKPLGGRYSNIYPFGMNETAFSADDNSLKRAKLINYLYETANYDIYKFQGILALDAVPEKKIWAEADLYWRKLPVALKWSNLYNSYTMRTKQRTLRAMRGLEIDDQSRDYESLSDTEVEQLAKVEHNRWNVEKLLMGYRKPYRNEDKYAHPEYKDELKKNKERFIHHDIRPYNQLDAVKMLDYEFCRYIPWIIKMTEKP